MISIQKMCGSCLGAIPENIPYFLRRNWRTEQWIPIKKWQDVGTGLCRPCADEIAQERNADTRPLHQRTTNKL